MDSAPLAEPKPTRVVLRETAKLMKDKSVSYAKGFAFMGFLYSGCECVVEKHRARHDAYNATLAGCMTGGLMAVTGVLCFFVFFLFVVCVFVLVCAAAASSTLTPSLRPRQQPPNPTNNHLAGPKAMCFGCATFAAFSTAIEYFTGGH